MRQVQRLVVLGMIFAAMSVAWLGFAGLMLARTQSQEEDLSGAVADLWGAPLYQDAPSLQFERTVREPMEEQVIGPGGQPQVQPDGAPVTRTVIRERTVDTPVPLDATDATVDLHLDPRRKGLIWFALYDVRFHGEYRYVHASDQPGVLVIQFAFPEAQGFYDDFQLAIDGVEQRNVAPTDGRIEARVPVAPGQTVSFSVGYASRGRDSFVYRPVPDGVGQVRDLELAMTTDFDRIDFPARSMSPSRRVQSASGWTLDWSFHRLVTGQGIGMVMPQRIQAGPLVAAMSASAPLSLGLYMVWIYVLGLLKRIEVHPMNHLFLAGAFFSFHLLFGYTADHLPVEAAFGLSAVVSLFLTTTYLRLVVGARFALVEAGLAQLLYLIGFSLAHFFEGWTGLTVTVLAIATLFLLMQLTGRIRWSEVFEPNAPRSYER